MARRSAVARKVNRLPVSVRNLAALHSLMVESRFRRRLARKKDVGLYDVFQSTRMDNWRNPYLRVICTIDVNSGEACMLEVIMKSLEER
jgi:hypothetical protein